MIELTPAQASTLREWFPVERPGVDTIAGHPFLPGLGIWHWWADRFPAPRAVVVEVGTNFLLRGDPAALTVDELADVVHGFVDAPLEFVPLLRAGTDRFQTWQRMVYVLDGPPAPLAVEVEARPLSEVDMAAAGALSPELHWIGNTWGGPASLAGSGYAWGAFVDGALASIACSFFVGVEHEELGVVTEGWARGRGLSAACAAGLCADIRARERRPSWTTSVGNAASRRVAEKLGFRRVRDDVLYVVGMDDG